MRINTQLYTTKLWFLLAIVLAIPGTRGITQDYSYPFQNPELPLIQRVDDLLNRLTLEEKIAQMMDQAPAIPRLGIPAYGWWNEALHGVARAGVATVFPQAIGMAATFNPELMYDIAGIISTEARAKHHFAASQKDFARYKGLTFWSPNINIFRDPRWGRGHETYGEDPYLTARLGVAFVRGMQGNHPRYFKVIATPKHYAVHSGPEPERHAFNAETNLRDLWETYLPAFEATVREAGAYSVMCAYNRYQGEACCASVPLLQEVLRELWDFQGYVVSDCGAIRDIHEHHQLVDSPEMAAAIAVKSGTDLNCGKMYVHLKNAVKNGYLSEGEIDLACRRLFTARFKLGMMDPDSLVPFTKIPYSIVDSEAHRRVNLQTARESIVLLKNENNILPLNKNHKRIAVIGPNADDLRVLLGNYFGFPSKFTTPRTGIVAQAGKDYSVSFAQGCNIIDAGFPFERIPAACFSSDGRPGLLARYYANTELQGEPVHERREPWIDDNWIKSGAVPGIERNNYSVRWTGYLTPQKSGKYKIAIYGDDGYRLYIDDTIIIDDWNRGSARQGETAIHLTAERAYKLKLEFFQAGSDAAITLKWLEPGADPVTEAVELAKESDVAVFVGGLNAQLEGEERDVPHPGFRGGDRTNLRLPAVQHEMLKKLHATGTPVILVLCSGSAVAVNWAEKNIPGIIQLWYAGSEGGTALAEVLFGTYNPAGRLPVTFYKSVNQLPPFEDYNMSGRTYRYFTDKPLYPFGYGLSYTTFTYSDPACKVEKDSLKVQFKLNNTGEYDGDEVIQIYVRKMDAPFQVARHSLVGFKREFSRQGETKAINIKVPLQPAAVYTDNRRQILPGAYTVFIGGAQPGYETRTSNVISVPFEYQSTDSN